MYMIIYKNQILNIFNYNIFKIVKHVKFNARKSHISKNINAFKNLTAKMSDLNDFLAGVLSAISCVGYMG